MILMATWCMPLTGSAKGLSVEGGGCSSLLQELVATPSVSLHDAERVQRNKSLQ